MIKIISLLLLISLFATVAETAQLGRITGEVNFREGPSRSTARIGRLAADAEVEVIKRESNGWYSIVHGGQRGYVHQDYIAIKTPPQIRTRTGIILIVIGATLIALHFFPVLPRVTMFLIFSFSGVLLLDTGFHFGMLYSLFSVSVGVLLVLVFVTQKEKKKAKSSEKAPDLYRNAA